MRKVLIIIFILANLSIQAQDSYTKGFQSGYKAGYCYNDFGCIEPIPPITPIPKIGESSYNFQDGYNRGFSMGLDDKKTKTTNRGSQYTTSTYTPQAHYQADDFSQNYNLLLKAMEMKQAQMEMYQAQNERNKQIKQEKAVGMMNQVKSYYNSLNQFPSVINNGWHKVISMNNYDFCEERKVYVENNKVTKYVIDDWDERSISYSLDISKGKTIVQLLNDDGGNGETIELYFLEYINNPNSSTKSPIGSGKVCFWTSWKRGGNMELYFDGNYAGKFTSFFENGSPYCGQQGTITIKYKPGTYEFKVVSEGNFTSKTWKGTVTINPNGCFLQGLTK